jgi:hypothetical protein
MWSPFEDGATIGQSGSESGTIARDEEHSMGARITLERNSQSAPFAITCGLYGWMVHTRLFDGEAAAYSQYQSMKETLATIAAMIPGEDDPQAEQRRDLVSDAVDDFFERYP